MRPGCLMDITNMLKLVYLLSIFFVKNIFDFDVNYSKVQKIVYVTK